MKKFISILLTISIMLTLTSAVFADNNEPNGGGTGTAGGDFDITIGKNVDGKLGNITSNVLGYVQFFGYAIAVGMLIYIGIKYMMASANEKADLKKGAINYVIGAIVVAAAATLVGMMVSIGEGITTP